MSQLVVDNHGCTDLQEEHHSLSTASSVSSHHGSSQSSALLSFDSRSARSESAEAQEVGTRGTPQVEFSKRLDYRILPIIWVTIAFYYRALSERLTCYVRYATSGTSKLKEFLLNRIFRSRTLMPHKD